MKIGLIVSLLFCGHIILAQQKVAEVELPNGYKRIELTPNSYANWVRNLPLKSNKSINSVEGEANWAKYIFDVFYVVDKPLYYKENLEQCADYSMRFWADYHKENNKLNELYLFNYGGEKKIFDVSKNAFKKFLRYHMAYSNSHSIKMGGNKVTEQKLIPGDMFVQNNTGGIGHVSVVVDAAENANGERIYLIGYSFMPAQEFHIEEASSKYGTQGWFTKKGFEAFLARRMGSYGSPVIRRF